MRAAPAYPAEGGALRFGPTFLVEQFRGFHAELLRVRQAAERIQPAAEAPPADIAAGPAESVPPENGGGDTIPPGAASYDPAAASRQLALWLEQAAVEAQRLGGGMGARLFREASFVMTALADEILLLGPPWRGQTRWRSTLLESRLFQTHDAGDRFFDRLDALLAARDPIEEPLAEIFLLALKLGFQGRYRDTPDGEAVLDRYRRDLFAVIANRAPDIAHPQQPLVPSAYAHTLTRAGGRRLPYVWGWALALLLFLGAFLLVSHLAWRQLTAPVLAIVEGVRG